MADSLSSTKFMDAPFFLQAAYLLPVRSLNRSARRLDSRSSHLSQLQQSKQLSKLQAYAEANTNAIFVIKPLQVVHRTVPLATAANRFLLDSWNIIALLTQTSRLDLGHRCLRISERHTISKVNSN